MTDDTERKKGELVDFMAEAIKRGKRPAESMPSISVKGSGNVVGNNNSVRITVHSKPATRLVVSPSSLHISQAQAAEIKDMVDRLAKLQGHTHQKLWTTLQRRFRFTSYHLLPVDQYPEVDAYLRAWLAKSAAPRTRKSMLARIHAQAKKIANGLETIKASARADYGTERLSELTDPQLWQLILKHGL